MKIIGDSLAHIRCWR